MSSSSRVSGKYAAGQLIALIVLAVIALPLLPLLLLVIAWIRLRDRFAASRAPGRETEGSTGATAARRVNTGRPAPQR
jgi:hypothetical protein